MKEKKNIAKRVFPVEQTFAFLLFVLLIKTAAG